MNIDELTGITDKFGTINKDKALELGYEVLSGDAWIEQDVDSGTRCSGKPDHRRECQQNKRPGKGDRRGGNGPTTNDADKVINEKVYSLSLIFWQMPEALHAAILNRFSAIRTITGKRMRFSRSWIQR